MQTHTTRLLARSCSRAPSPRRVLQGLSDLTRPLHMDGFASGCNCLLIMRETMQVRARAAHDAAGSTELLLQYSAVLPCAQHDPAPHHHVVPALAAVLCRLNPTA